MNSRTTPYRSEVARWSPEDLAEYFRRLNYKDCEKVAKKYSITGQRFLNMSENDIQKFPKLSVPIITKLSQEIKRNEEKKGFFPKRLHTQRLPETTEFRQEEDNGWSSFEDDDYESPDEQDLGDGVDYETPDDDIGIEEGDYEPPPPNDDKAHCNPVFSSHSMHPVSEYIDRHPSDRSKTYPEQPPIPPKRPEPAPAPVVPSFRNTMLPFHSPPISTEINREQNTKSFKPPAPSVDRSKKPPLNRSFEKDITGPGKAGLPKLPSLTPQLRSLGVELAKIQKPPVPPTEYERSSTAARRMTPPLINCQTPGRKTEVEDANVSQWSLPQPSPHLSKTRSKPSNIMPSLDSSLSLGRSLPPRLQQGSISRTPSKGPADSRPPLPPPNRQWTLPVKAENEVKDQCHKYNEDLPNQKWYVADITRPEAEVTLRNINQDGTFLVRDSSRKSIEKPYVLMVLYNNKVYNIQISYQEEDQTYFLGTGMKGNEDFTSVADIIEYFQRMPLRLIDGKDRCSRKQCMLTYPAGSL